MQWFERRSVGCAHSFPVGLIKDFFFPGVSLTLSPMSALTAENTEVTVGIAGSYAATVTHFVIPLLLVYFSQKGTREKVGVYLKHTSPVQHKLWVMLVITFAVFATNTITRLSIKHLSKWMVSLYN